MAFSLRAWLFERKFFCCCLPVRFGVIVMSFLTWLFSGVVSFLLLFEVASRHDPPLSSEVRISFIVAGMVESILFITSILGFVGAIVRKQSFVQIYAYFVYIHFVINLGVGSYFLWMITHTAALDQESVCTDDVQNNGAQNACNSVFRIGKGAFIGTIIFIWLIELYGSLIVTRYAYLVRSDKREARARLEYMAGVGIVKHSRYESAASEANVGLLGSQQPRDEYAHQASTPQYAYEGLVMRSSTDGYGGGSNINANAEQNARQSAQELAPTGSVHIPQAPVIYSRQ